MRHKRQPGDLYKAHMHKVAHNKSKAKSHKKVSPITGLKEGSKMDMKLDKKIANRLPKTVSAYEPPKTKHKSKKPRLGSGERFAALKEKLAKKPGVKNPGAIAAKIGREKYGNKKMTQLAASGKDRAAKQHHKLKPKSRLKESLRSPYRLRNIKFPKVKNLRSS